MSPPTPEAQSDQILDSPTILIERHLFYQRSYRKLVITNLLLIIVIFSLVGFSYYQSSSFTIPQYFPTTPDGAVINSPPDNINHLTLDKLHFDSMGVLQEYPEIKTADLDLSAEDSNEHAILVWWVSKALLGVFELDFVNYRQVMQDMRKYFTPKGYEKFLEALENSKNLDTIKKGKRIAFATLRGPVKVCKTGVLEGHKVWSVEAPIMVTYEGNEQEEQLVQNMLAVVKIARVSTLQSPFFGLAIYQINFKVI